MLGGRGSSAPTVRGLMSYMDNDEDFSMYIQLHDGGLVAKEAATNSKFLQQIVDIRPNSSIPATALSSGGQQQVQVLLTPGFDCDIPDQIFVRMRVSNGNGSDAAALVPPQFWYSKVEFYMNEQLCDTLYPTQWWVNSYLYSKWIEYQSFALAQGVNPNTFQPYGNSFNAGQAALPNSAIAVSSAKDFYVWLPNLWKNMPIGLMQNGVNDVKCRLQFYFSSAGSGLLDATNFTGTNAAITDVSLVDFSIRAIGANYKDSEDRKAMVNHLRSRQHTYRYNYQSQFPINTGAIIAGTQYTQIMNISGLFSALAIFMVPVSPSGNSYYTPLQLNFLQIQDASGNSLIGSNIQYEDAFLRYCVPVGDTESLFQAVLYAYLVAWSNNEMVTFKSAIDLGSMQLDPSYRIQYTPTATAGSGNQLFILGQQFATVSVDSNGQVTLSR